MDKLDLKTPVFTDENIQKLSEIFPSCVTESADGKSIDFDLLKQELSNHIVDGNKERYQLTWPGKAESLVAANSPINKTLRPDRKASKDFDKTENLFIEGDNLEVLKLLQETYLGKVKMIYIDPPYNTGSDFVYKDNFTQDKAQYDEEVGNKDEEGGRLVSNPDSNGRFHSDWMSMMYPRLKLARNLLKDDGVIFISIDDTEVDNVRKICDEVFGRKNFLSQIIWQKIHSTKNDAKYFSDSHEYIVCYAKSIENSKILLLPRTEKMNSRFKNPDNDPRGLWSSGDLVANEVRSGGHFDIVGPTGNTFNVPADKHWVYAKDNLMRFIEEGRIWFGKNGDAFPRLKRYLSEVQQGRKADTLWLSSEVGHNQESKREIKSLFDGHVFFDTPKPVRLIQRCIELIMSPDDLVLDFFAGSSTTAHSVMQLNAEDGGHRKFIMAQLAENTDKKSEAFKAGYKTIAEIGKERIRRAGEKIKSDNASKDGIGDLDVGFRVLKVDSSNMKDVYYTPDKTSQSDILDLANNIKEDRTDEDLLFQVLLDWGIDLSVKIERKEIAGRAVYFADDDYLAACFERDLDESFVKEVIKCAPRKVVLRDSGFKSSSIKINVEQLFKQANIEVKVI
ncbi:site-specific DNA-methyltransferase [bacterium]|nr:site-specific DNA-methyltransferase [bacterium]